MAVNGTCLSLGNKRRATLRRCASQCRIIIERFMLQRTVVLTGRPACQ